uniref:Uncharacterized protein n=1 Tax=Spongospora subterranea TaxID=70186 RepID=A0A0H5QSU1_9EUKA|eukprot:CRZ04757.1 hypothetical protein [Spongospora subterranea]
MKVIKCSSPSRLKTVIVVLAYFVPKSQWDGTGLYRHFGDTLKGYRNQFRAIVFNLAQLDSKVGRIRIRFIHLNPDRSTSGNGQLRTQGRQGRSTLRVETRDALRSG